MACTYFDMLDIWRNFDTNPVKSHEWGKDGNVTTANGTHPWSFVMQTLGSVASLLAANLYQRNHGMKL